VGKIRSTCGWDRRQRTPKLPPLLSVGEIVDQEPTSNNKPQRSGPGLSDTTLRPSDLKEQPCVLGMRPFVSTRKIPVYSGLNLDATVLNSCGAHYILPTRRSGLKLFGSRPVLCGDEIHTIIPYPEYRPQYSDRRFAEAFELIGVSHVPDHEEKSKAHEIIENFATRPLPKSFSYKFSIESQATPYELYPEKFFPETYDCFKRQAYPARN
jgi:hypothetical protein